MNYLVSGATGFIGSHLVEALIKGKKQVRILVRKSSNITRLKQLKVEICYGSLEDEKSLIKAVENVDIIFHCAAKVSDWGKRKEFFATNVTGTRNLIDAAVEGKIKRFIHVSSSDFYGYLNQENVTENHIPRKRSFPYTESKQEAERLVWHYIKERQLPATILRPPSVYGPGSISLVKDFVDYIQEGKMMLIRGGKVIAGLCYIGNLVDALILAGQKKQCVGKAYNVSDGTKISWKKYIDSLCRMLGKKPVEVSIPYPLAYGTGMLMEIIWDIFGFKGRPLLTRMAAALLGTHQGLSIEKAREELGYDPKIDFTEGMRLTGEWLKEVGYPIR